MNNGKDQSIIQLDPREVMRTFTKELQCPRCNNSQFVTTFRYKYNPLAGPKELIPCSPEYFCAICKLPMFLAMAAASGKDWAKLLEQMENELRMAAEAKAAQEASGFITGGVSKTVN